MDKAYDAKLHDSKWQNYWDRHQVAKPETVALRHAEPSGKPYTIIMPPPNVTGALHLGHALFLALQDTLIRWRRMCGDEALYLPGSDHASIAVNKQVVDHLATQGIHFKDLGRDEFLNECWKWVDEYRPRIFAQMKRIGASCDWGRVKFTMDPELNLAVEEAFIRMHKSGLIYQAERLVNWSPKGQTVLSDLEVIFEEREGKLWNLRYPVLDASGKLTDQFIVVATTRPETLLGDTAVAVHPDDERYANLKGKKVLIPIVNREVPVVFDSFVEKDFGTGIVKITPAHDFNDFEVGKRHSLPVIRVLSPEAKILANLGGESEVLAGLDRFEARKQIVEMLEAKNLVESIQPHKNRVGISERHGEVVEPHLSTQWYVRMSGMAEKAKSAVESGELEIVPKEFSNQFLRWMENIEDWCISRQLWWGQQIPAYYGTKTGKVIVANSAPSDSEHGETFTRDSDVLDTWFSSGLWPFSTMGWPNENSKDLQKFFPGDVLETGFDIIFFWVARMVMMSSELTGKIPFKKVCMHPMVRDEHGQKMSKTKGNVIDPLDMIEAYGADTLRVALNGLCVQGRDMRMSEERVQSYRNFINKVWNATRFVLMGPELDRKLWEPRPSPTLLHDRWILSRLDAVARDVNKSWTDFRMQEATDALYHFIWNDFCDWYLEAVKTTRELSQPIAIYVLVEALKLLHPLIPHVSEELYHCIPGVGENDVLALSVFPKGESFADTDALAEFRCVQDAVGALRTLRSENKVKPSLRFEAFLVANDTRSEKLLTQNAVVIQSMCGLSQLKNEKFPDNKRSTKVVFASLSSGVNVEVFVGLDALVDLEEEKSRLIKEIEQTEKLVLAQDRKLSNESFVAKAPPEVVENERRKLTELQDKLTKSKEALGLLSS
jgi:valyl-tRNA synthetase